MNCKKCGKKIEGEYQYCYKCGDNFDIQSRQRITGEDLIEPSPIQKETIQMLLKYKFITIPLVILFMIYLISLFF